MEALYDGGSSWSVVLRTSVTFTKELTLCPNVRRYEKTILTQQLHSFQENGEV